MAECPKSPGRLFPEEPGKSANGCLAQRANNQYLQHMRKTRKEKQKVKNVEQIGGGVEFTPSPNSLHTNQAKVDLDGDGPVAESWLPCNRGFLAILDDLDGGILDR